METFIEKLDQLIALKKIKGHKITKKESEEFISAWRELVGADNGLSERAERYFYEGFIFAGATPFVKWVMSSEDPFAALDELFTGQKYGKDTVSTFRVLVSTLAQILKEKAYDRNLICRLIKRIPAASKNKERKTIGDGQRIVYKYFISEIDSSLAFPSLYDLELKPVFIKSFIEVFDELLIRLDLTSLSKKDVQTLAAVNRWLHPNDTTASTQKDSDNVQAENTETREEIPVVTIQQDKNTLFQNDNSYDQLVSILNLALSIADNMHNTNQSTEKKCTALQQSISTLEREVEALNNQLKASSQRESSLETQLSDRASQISNMNLKIIALEENIQELSAIIEAKEQEIAQRIQMIDALSRDRAKQSDEQLHRLASQLKIEYRDFRDAEALAMDCDLGENMREQLKNIFSILIKAGISLD